MYIYKWRWLEVDLAQLGLRLFVPLLESEELRSNGLAGLSCLLAAKSQAASVLQLSPAPLQAMLEAIRAPGAPRAIGHRAMGPWGLGP